MGCDLPPSILKVPACSWGLPWGTRLHFWTLRCPVNTVGVAAIWGSWPCTGLRGQDESTWNWGPVPHLRSVALCYWALCGPGVASMRIQCSWEKGPLSAGAPAPPMPGEVWGTWGEAPTEPFWASLDPLGSLPALR